MKTNKNDISRRIPEYLERGRNIIFAERFNEWVNCINICLSKEYGRPTLIIDVIDIMEALEISDNMQEVVELLKSQKNDPDTEKLLRTIVCKFSKKGPEFYEATVNAKLSDATIAYLKRKKGTKYST